MFQLVGEHMRVAASIFSLLVYEFNAVTATTTITTTTTMARTIEVNISMCFKDVDTLTAHITHSIFMTIKSCPVTESSTFSEKSVGNVCNGMISQIFVYNIMFGQSYSRTFRMCVCLQYNNSLN